MTFPIKVCVVCSEEFELRPGKPGFANRCPACSEPEEPDAAAGKGSDLVDRKSEAAVAGLKAFDVILKVGTEPVTNLAGWDRALRANEGRPVQVTILRDKKQETLTMQVDSKHHQGSLDKKGMAPATETAQAPQPLT